ncbi:biotin/lipoate A/B protein ligase family protein [Prolixibacteraceae bacterium]|nr:biotin/lipoate A/B protein ligase family protein [Prolixibacteraceae bacterium]
MIKIICSNTNNPIKNIATEEYLLKNCKESFLFLYINSSSVIIGKHQNAFAEVSAKYIKDHNIPLIRRISGGGTVVHDEGNLNFSFITNQDNIETLSYKKCIEPIREFLCEKYDAKAILSERNDIQINNRKVTGSAFHIYKKRIIAHGTLLINSNLKEISNILKSSSAMFDSKGVKSKRSRIMNLGEIHNIPSNINHFKADMIQYFIGKGYIQDSIEHIIDFNVIDKLCQEKYTTWDWNIGYGPKFTFHIKNKENNEHYMFHVERGYISSALNNNVEIINKEEHIPFRETILPKYFSNNRDNTIATEIERFLL